jgi:hypothetical protein
LQIAQQPLTQLTSTIMNLTDFDSADERYHTSNLYTSMEGTVLCSSLSSLSIVASLATITIILRSYDGLTSVYHRFIFCSSFAIILFSLAMALNTLPIPKDTPYTQFEGLHIGNQSTCDAQGFIYMYGFTADYSYFVGLLIYYMCSITFKMMDTTFQKFVEPLFHALAISLSIYIPTSALTKESINPSIHKNWCARESLPFWCDGNDEKSYDENYIVCIRGDTELEQIMEERLNVFFAVVAVIVFISMIMIILSVYQSERSMPLDPTSSSNSRTMGANATKVVLVQISAYLFSIVLVSVCSYLSVSYREISSLSMQYFYIIIGSTRGMLNFIIFVGHKVYNLQRVNECLSLRDIIWKVLYSRNENVFVFDNIPSRLQLPETSDPSNKDRSEKSSNDSRQSFCSDPTKAAHPITMFHLNQVADEDISLPSKEDDNLSANDDDLPSKNDMSSSIGTSFSEKQSLDLSSNTWKYA